MKFECVLYIGKTSPKTLIVKYYPVRVATLPERGGFLWFKGPPLRQGRHTNWVIFNN